jgi:hypothetical protein
MSHLRWKLIAEMKASRPNKNRQRLVTRRNCRGIHIFITLRININRKVGCLALGLAAFFAAMDFSDAATNETPRLVSVDLRQTNGPPDTMFKFGVGAGRANEGLRAEWTATKSFRLISHGSGGPSLTR